MEKPRFLHKTVRGYNYQQGPTDVKNPKNYNQRLTAFMEDTLDECEDNPQRFPGMVEGYFKENLLKRYNLIRYLKAEIRREKAKNELKEAQCKRQRTTSSDTGGGAASSEIGWDVTQELECEIESWSTFTRA